MSGDAARKVRALRNRPLALDWQAEALEDGFYIFLRQARRVILHRQFVQRRSHADLEDAVVAVHVRHFGCVRVGEGSNEVVSQFNLGHRFFQGYHRSTGLASTGFAAACRATPPRRALEGPAFGPGGGSSLACLQSARSRNSPALRSSVWSCVPSLRRSRVFVAPVLLPRGAASAHTSRPRRLAQDSSSLPRRWAQASGNGSDRRSTIRLFRIRKAELQSP